MPTTSPTGRNSPDSRRCHGARDCGFTLLEVLVTLVILSVGIVVVLQAFQTSIVALEAARDSLRMELLLKEYLAETEGAVRQSGSAETGVLEKGFAAGMFRGFRLQCQVREEQSYPIGAERAGTLCRATAVVRGPRQGAERTAELYFNCESHLSP